MHFTIASILQLINGSDVGRCADDDSIRSLQHKITVKVFVEHVNISAHHVKAITSKTKQNVYVFCCYNKDSDTEPVHMGAAIFISSHFS